MVRRIRFISRIVKVGTEINSVRGEALSPKKELLGWDEIWAPRVDIYEKEDEIVVEVELPGVSAREITLSLLSNRMEIRGVKRETPGQEGVKYLRVERECGRFRRFISLPAVINPEKTRAILENGILTVVLKKHRNKKDREISVNIQKDRE